MAKKDKKKSKKKDTAGTDPVGAVRTAVERTFQATADSAQSTRTRAQDLVDEVAGAAGRLREMIEHVGVLEDLKKQVDSLARRVQALEAGGGASKPAAQGRSTASRSSSSRATGSRATAGRAKSSGGTARKPAASRAKAASSMPASSPSRSGASGARKSTSSRSSSAKKTS